MAAARIWGRIQDGATFEALATTLVFFEDNGAALFGRRGRDGGQDVRSRDGATVYQAKHHEDGVASKAIADAKKEAKKIKEYREPGQLRYAQWQGVKHWILVTNAAFNPTDHQRWKSEVEPLFQTLGFTANYWEQAHLDALLDKHPEVDRSFFGNDTRVLLTLPEARERLATRAPFLPRAETIAFQGRAEEVRYFRDFLASDKTFIVVTGNGGIGKTRFLIEAGSEIAADGFWQVFWANVSSMEAGGHWYDAIVPERHTLLLVDEPETDQLLRQLVEQVGGQTGRASRWKIAVAVRSPKDPVLRFLDGARMQQLVARINLTSLPTEAAEAVCLELIESGSLAAQTPEWKTDAAQQLSQRYEHHPIWLTLAVRVLEERGSLGGVPETAQKLADQYVEEIVREQQAFPQEQVRSVLRWVSLLGTLNRENDTTLKSLANTTGLGSEKRLLSLLAELVKRHALEERGAYNRLVEMKPDVLRDHILRQWLVTNVGFGAIPLRASEDAEALISDVLNALLKDSLGSLGQAALRSLARTEWLLREGGQSVPLLEPFFQGLHKAIANLPASVRLSAVEAVIEIAEIRPSDAFTLSRAFRNTPCATEKKADGVFSSREIGHDDVVLALAWLVFHAAMGANTPEQRKAVLEELMSLVEAEEDIGARRVRALPNDGKRAEQLVARVVGGGPQFWGDYEEEVGKFGLLLLDTVATTQLTLGRAKTLRALLMPTTSLEREQMWYEGYTAHIQTNLTVIGCRSWETRAVLLARTREILEKENVAVNVRVILWQIIASAQSSASRAIMDVARMEEALSKEDQRTEDQRALESELLALKPTIAAVETELLDAFRWSYKVLSSQKVSLKELDAARPIWDWHCKYDDSQERKQLAETLEALYQSNELVKEYDALVSYDSSEQHTELARAKAESLAAIGDSAAVINFVERALQFFSNDEEIYRVLHVAWHLGALAPTTPSVQEFIRQTLSKGDLTPYVTFASAAASSWAASLRTANEQASASSLVQELVDHASAPVRVLLLRRLYGSSSPVGSIGALSSDEHCFLRSMAPAFLSAGQAPEFLDAIGWTFVHDWAGFRIVVENVLSQLQADRLAVALNALVRAVHSGFRLLENEGHDVPIKLGRWLLDQLVRVPDIDASGDSLHWHLREILKTVPRPTVKWLMSALRFRLSNEFTDLGGTRLRAFPSTYRLGSYVSPIRAEDAVEADIQNVVGELVEFVRDNASMSHLLPQYLLDVDPDRVLVPSEVARRISTSNVTDENLLLGLARIGGFYGRNTAAWRVIAKAVTNLALQLDEGRRYSLFHALTDPRPRHYYSKIGQVPEGFVAELGSVKQLLEQETDQNLRSFWQWSLKNAEAELRWHEERAKEKRGE
jgi:hypothetical protein